MAEIKAILLCSTRFAIPALQEMAFFNQLAAIVIPSKNSAMIEQVQSVLNGITIPIVLVDRDNFEEKIIQAIQQYNVNLGLMMTFSFRLPKSVYELPAKGFFNFHPSPLPAYRGADPIFQQIKNKEQTAGVTIHKLDENFDTGAIVQKEIIKIEPTDTYGILTSKLSHVAAKIARVLIKMISFDIDIPSKMQDESVASSFKKQSANDIIINWKEMDATTIIALINACNPWNKGAVAKLNNKIIRLVEAEKIGGSNEILIPGRIFSISSNGLFITTINSEAISVNIIYTDEGFLGTKQFNKIGLLAGNQFDIL
ncbi:MAG TPA: formyltransferase family protein [Ferruginibacter sp.]|nr:formyltransferase family protein [Ferruginibacter sp.]